MPFCAVNFVTNNFYTPSDVYAAFGAWETLNPSTVTVTAATHLGNIKTVRTDARFRLDEAFYVNYQIWSYSQLGQTADATTNAEAWANNFDSVTGYLDLGTVFADSSVYDLTDLPILTNIAIRVAETKLKWANLGVVCDNTCLADTSTILDALIYNEDIQVAGTSASTV